MTMNANAIMAKVVREEYIHPQSAPHMTIYVAVLDNGFVITNYSAPVMPEDFDEEIGRSTAREKAIHQLVEFEAYLLREHLTVPTSGSNT